MAMGAKPATRRNSIVVRNNEQAVARVPGIVMRTKAEAVFTVEPADIGGVARRS
jgi:hypothetical protein